MCEEVTGAELLYFTLNTLAFLSSSQSGAVEKEVDIRRRVMRDFNRREEEFASLREYNDYLEFVETIIFNLSNGINVESTKKQMEDYKRQFRDQIQRNKLSKGSRSVHKCLGYPLNSHT